MRHAFSSALSMRATLRRYLGGFTLVELIVVITILALLWAIWLLSFSGYSSGARDSTRLEDMSNIQKSLAISMTTVGKYPLPDNTIQIISWGATLSYQGYAGKTVLSTIKFNGAGQDPLDNGYYTYSTDVKQSQFALMGYLENSGNLTSYENFLHTAVYADATSYSSRYPSLRGDPIGILVSSGSLVPAQSAGVTIDVGSTVTPYTAYFSSMTTVSGTGSTLNTYITAMTTPTTTATTLDWRTVGSSAWPNYQKSILKTIIANSTSAGSRTTSTFGSTSVSSYGWWVLAPNGKIYGIPGWNTSVLEIDPVAHTTSTFGTSLWNGAYLGGVLAPNRPLSKIITST